MFKRIIHAPVFYSCILLVISQVLTLALIPHEQTFVEVTNFSSPQAGLEIPLIYFFAAVIVIGLILFFIPVTKLRLILVIVFALVFAWGIFILLSLISPVYISAPIALLAGVFWFFQPRVWLHNILLLLALVSVGLVFGYLMAPWTAMLFLAIIAVYDAVSVRFGHMMWMAEKLAESNVLPAFVIPKSLRNWNLNLKNAGFKILFEDRASREYSLLGGGDIGFPLLLAVSVCFIYGYTGAIIICVFSLLGLIGAYLVQAYMLKGKPTPALPTIALASLIGFLIVRFVI